jgi:hypothetical protein
MRAVVPTHHLPPASLAPLVAEGHRVVRSDERKQMGGNTTRMAPLRGPQERQRRERVGTGHTLSISDL